MIDVRKSDARGHSQSEWLNSYHTFSFGHYHDPAQIGFGDLRVINEDTVAPDTGFERHPHKNMEIISYVVQGSLEHKDSMGTGSVIEPGEIQVMSAGTGIEHSEFNHSSSTPLHFLQIWILPESAGLQPSYQQATIAKRQNSLILIAAREAQAGIVTIHQDVKIYAAYLTPGSLIDYSLQNNRIAWLQLIAGKCELNGHILNAGDGAAIRNEKQIHIQCTESAEFLLFDLFDK